MAEIANKLEIDLKSLWDIEPNVDIHGYGEIANFDRAFVKCVKDGKYPGPTEINIRRAPLFKRFNRLNGRCTNRRLQLMTWFGIPYRRGWGYEHMPNKGELPMPESKYANTLSIDDYESN